MLEKSHSISMLHKLNPLISSTRFSLKRLLINGLSAVRHLKLISKNLINESQYISFPPYPNSSNPRSPQKEITFEIDDYYLLKKNKKKAIDLRKRNFICNDIDLLTCSIHHNVIATENNCLFDKFNNPINESVLWRIQTNGELKFPNGELEPISNNKKPAINITSGIWIRFGHFYHFGHLLTETCSALYPLILWKTAGLDIEKINIIMHTKYKKNLESIKKLLNITGQNIYFHGPLSENDIKIKRLFIPHPTIVLRGFSSRKHALITQQFLDLWAPSDRGEPEDTELNRTTSLIPFNLKDHLLFNRQREDTKYYKLWLSRTKFKECLHPFPEEKQIETILSQMGWKIIHPQQHPLRTQLNALKDARVVAGLAGSAFHLLYGVKDKKKIIQLTWRDKGCTYDKQFKSQDFDYHLIRCLNLSNRLTEFRDGYNTKKIIELISRLSQ